MSNTRQCYMFQQTYVLWWNNCGGVYTTHAWMSLDWKSRALERRGCKSWQFCVLQLKGCCGKRVTKTQQLTEWGNQQGKNCVKSKTHWIFSHGALMTKHPKSSHAKSWNSERSQKLRWDRCWVTKSLPHCLHGGLNFNNTWMLQLLPSVPWCCTETVQGLLTRTAQPCPENRAQPNKISIVRQCSSIWSAHTFGFGFFLPLPPLLCFFSLSGTKNCLITLEVSNKWF